MHDLVPLKRRAEYLRTGVRFRLRYRAVGLTISGVMPKPVSFAGSSGSDALTIAATGSARFASDLGAATTKSP